jgi:hypothetical protein
MFSWKVLPGTSVVMNILGNTKLQITGSVYCCLPNNDIFAPALKEKQGKSDM